jgi:hypothetical protein
MTVEPHLLPSRRASNDDSPRPSIAARRDVPHESRLSLRRGEVTAHPSVDDNRRLWRKGRARLVEYSARNAAGQVVSTGRFIVPLVAVSEFRIRTLRPESDTARSG